MEDLIDKLQYFGEVCLDNLAVKKLSWDFRRRVHNIEHFLPSEM